MSLVSMLSPVQIPRCLDPNSYKIIFRSSKLLTSKTFISHNAWPIVQNRHSSTNMEKPEFCLLFFLIFIVMIISSSYSYTKLLNTVVINSASTTELANYTAISDFRLINRRVLIDCPTLNPYVEITVSPNSGLGDDEFVKVDVKGILFPTENDWVAMVSSSHADGSSCPFNGIMYAQTGDLSRLPLLCHYPVKSQFLSTDPDYLTCKKSECKTSLSTNKNRTGSNSLECIKTCGATLSFHVVNIRTDIEFILFGGGFETPCVRSRASPIAFANSKMPLHGHLASVDSTSTSMRLTWVSGDKASQTVQFGDGKSISSQVATFTQDDMCTSVLDSPARDFGWHDPGFIHSGVMTGLDLPLWEKKIYVSDSVGWSEKFQFRTPSAGGAPEVKFIAFGDMGKTPRDPSVEHYIQPGALNVTKAMNDEVASGNVESIFHIGDISYATGFLVEWDYFLNLISPLASKVPYMTAIGNHERDYIDSGSVYITPDSGGECGVAYETYFPMPTAAKDKPWYSIEQGPVHFTVISTEHDWSKNSEQYNWIKSNLASVDRSRTPWLVFMGHRPMYSSAASSLLSVDFSFVASVENLLLANKVDLVLFGHVHNYERTCAVYQGQCLGMPVKDKNGIDTYNSANYTAPVHAIIGMAGFKLDTFPPVNLKNWSLSRHSEFGYARFQATKTLLKAQFVNANSRKVEDSFQFSR